nr:hypothetical protein [Tanacetum cinerariifolium]
MADLKFVDQHNMVACLEKTKENAEFHQIVDFLSTCSINYALTTQAPRNHIGGAYAQTRFETAFKRSSDPPLSTGHIVGSREDKMEKETDLTEFVPPTPHDSPFSGGFFLWNNSRLLSDQKVAKESQKIRKEANGKNFRDKALQDWDKSNKTKELNVSNKGSGEVEVFDYTTATEKDVNAAEPVSTAGDAVNTASVILDYSAAGPSTSV